MRLFLVFLLAFLIRLIGINQSLWLDEAITARVVTQYSFGQIISQFLPFDFHPPLYYLFMKIWTNIFGASEISLRFPSIAFSLLTGFLIYKIGTLIKSEKFGFWSAIFFLFNPLIIYYSQEARMYMMTTFLLTGAFYYFISNLKYQTSKVQIKNQIFFNLYIFLALMTFYGSLFLIAAFLIYFFYKKQYKNFAISLLVVFAYFLLISPLLLKQYNNSKTSLSMVKNWSLVLGSANLKNLLLIPIKFMIGRISFYPKIFYWLGLVCLFVMLADIILVHYQKKFLKNFHDQYFRNLSLIFLVAPITLAFFVSFFIPLLNYFRFLYLVPFFSIYLTYVALYNEEKYHYYMATLFIVFSLAYLIFPIYHREDWKSLVSYLNKNNLKKVYIINQVSDPLSYYQSKAKIISLENLCNEKYFINSNEKIALIPYASEIWGIDYKSCLSRQNKTLFSKKSFRGLTIEYYR